MPATKDKRLTEIDTKAIRRIADAGGALTLKELAVLTNYNYLTVRSFAKEPGFPILAGKVTMEDYKLWRQRRLGLIPKAP